MPTYRHKLVRLTRRIGKVLPMLMDKREREHKQIKLNITDRVDLLELKRTIEEILEECKDDGYHC